MKYEIADATLELAYQTAHVVESAWENSTEEFLSDTQWTSARPDNFNPRIITAHDGTDYVGVAVLLKSMASSDMSQLTWVAVLPEKQKQGIGKAIVEIAQKQANLEQHVLVFCTSTPQFYLKIGLNSPFEYLPGRWLFAIPPKKRAE